MTQQNFKIPDCCNASLTRNFTQVPTQMLRNPEISCKAKIVLCLLLSNKKGWKTYIESLAKMLKEGESTIKRAVKELEKNGYLIRIHCRDIKTKIWSGSFWAYTDIPHNFDLEETLNLLNEAQLEPVLKDEQLLRKHNDMLLLKTVSLKTASGKTANGFWPPKNTNNNNIYNNNIKTDCIINTVKPSFEEGKESTGLKPTKKLRRRKPPIDIDAPKKIRRTLPNKKQVPDYVQKIILQWNEYPTTTTHKLDALSPSKTIKTISRYLSQLKSGRLGPFDPIWVKTLPAGWQTRKWTLEEIEQGVKALSLLSRNEYWPEGNKDNFKKLSSLLYNPKTKRSYFLNVMYKRPKKITETGEIKFKRLTQKFYDADIWKDKKRPPKIQIDQALRSTVEFRKWLSITTIERLNGYDHERLGQSFWNFFIHFLENSSGLALTSPYSLSIDGFATERFIKDLEDEINGEVQLSRLLTKFRDKRAT